MNNSYNVADFFCGGGGFSEGFKLAGFDIVFAVDKWQPAIITHHANHSKADSIMDDVIRISNLSDKEFHKLVPDTEVIIGSPPCTFFSNSNKSGKGDKSLGIQLIKAYLRIVARKKIKKNSILKHWVLENVPNVEFYIKDVYSYRDLGIDTNGELQVKYPSSKVYNAKYFGVASNRKRYFCGNYPEPKQLIYSDKDVRTISDILQFLKSPNNNLEEKIQDPNYADFQMLSKEITDHHYIMEIAEFEWKKAKRMKQDKGYMGKMSFPENLDKPSRTIMATMSCSARESMIYPYIPKENRYRVPTVREIASIMSYPLDYRFYGKSKGIKYKLVGNSVPPKMSFAIASSIANYNKLPIPKNYIPIIFSDKPIEDFINLNLNEFHLNVEKRKKDNAKFKYHIPYLIINAFRVELTNYNSDFKNLNFKWDVDIHKSQGKNAKIYHPIIDISIFERKHIKKINSFCNKTLEKLTNADDFQKHHCQIKLKKTKKDIGPYELLDIMKKFLDNNFEKEYFEKIIFLDKEQVPIPYIIGIGFHILKKLAYKLNN